MHKLMLWVVAHKKTIILIIAGLLIITGPVYWFMMRPKKSLSSGEKILTEAAIKQEKYRLSDAQQQKFFDKDKFHFLEVFLDMLKEPIVLFY